MKKFILNIALTILLLNPVLPVSGQDRLNTAADASYMKPSEKAMIREINLLRSDPKGYLGYVDAYVKENSKGQEAVRPNQKSYTLTFNYELIDGKEKLKSIDTVWFDAKDDEAHAIASLRKELNNLKPLSILRPDKGIYEAASHYAQDENKHGWKLHHQGSDGSWPWDRIKKYSPEMVEGNENIAGRFPEPSIRQIVIILLIDKGIKGYGHRENLLDPRWTHVACYDAGLQDGMYRWVQNFGQKK